MSRKESIRAGLPRAVELVLAVAFLLISFPVLVLAGLLIVVTSGRPFIFRQQRMGRFGEEFTLLKLRTMSLSRNGPQVTSRNDPRITRLGRVLRRLKIDELPQLWNVIKGDLALVGPRPEVPCYVDFSNEKWRRVLQVCPGITDPVTLLLRNEEALIASASGDPEEYYRRLLIPFKLDAYLEYLGSRNWWMDAKVLGATVGVVGFGYKRAEVTSQQIEGTVNGTSPAGKPLAPSSVVRSSLMQSRVVRELVRFYDALPQWVPKMGQNVIDLGILACAFWLAYLIRFEFSLPVKESRHALLQMPIVVAVQAAAFMACHLHRILWRYVTLDDAQKFGKAGFWTALPLLAARFLLPSSLDAWRVPLSVIAVDTVLMVGGTLSARIARRSAHRSWTKGKPDARGSAAVTRRRVLLIGAGELGQMVAQEVEQRGHTDFEIVGLVDDDPRKEGAVISGHTVLGATAALPALTKKFGIDLVILTIANAAPTDFQRILGICKGIPVRARTVPPLHELVHGRVTLDRFREVDIADLLGRSPVSLDGTARQAFIANKVVMVTGAGGSIGSELARQVATLRPARLLMVERSEFALFTSFNQLTRLYPEAPATPILADVGDGRRLSQVFSQYKPQIVVHAAAHKHVPMIEDNPTECVTNNILATQTLGKVAGEHGTEAFVLISTDKAVRPTSLMGASKRVTEFVVQALDQKYETRYVAVRFGNVIGSAGSVIPTFREQIQRGGPVTVTHPEMTRYFMTIPEAAELVLEAATMGRGGEIFVLDMGAPVKILDLAKDLITLSGFTPFEDIDIAFTGIRPGEKLHEELELGGESMTKTRNPKISIGKIARRPTHEIARLLRRFETLLETGDTHAVRLALSEAVQESSLLPKGPISAGSLSRAVQAGGAAR